MEVFLKMIIIFLKVFCKPWDVFFSCPRNLVESSWKIVDSCIFSGFNLRVLSWTFTVDLWGVVSHIGWGTSGLGKPSFLTKVWVSLNPLNGVWELKMFESVEGEEVHLFFWFWAQGDNNIPFCRSTTWKESIIAFQTKAPVQAWPFWMLRMVPVVCHSTPKSFVFFVGKSKSKNLLGFELDSDGFHVYLSISMKGKICWVHPGRLTWNLPITQL